MAAMVQQLQQEKAEVSVQLEEVRCSYLTAASGYQHCYASCFAVGMSMHTRTLMQAAGTCCSTVAQYVSSCHVHADQSSLPRPAAPPFAPYQAVMREQQLQEKLSAAEAAAAAAAAAKQPVHSGSETSTPVHAQLASFGSHGSSSRGHMPTPFGNAAAASSVEAHRW
jgi:hypothetical protein